LTRDEKNVRTCLIEMGPLLALKEKGRREKAHSSPMSYLTNTKSQKGLDLERGIKEG
jgi:hypothetical protein